MPKPLPIDPHLPHVVQTLQAHSCVILAAPPGTGKTTRVAPAMLASLSAEQTIVLVQPRRIAARAAAARIADECNSSVGDLVGYQVRFESRVSRQTRLVCVTPGILLRRMQSDPLLDNVAVVVLDEFHERSLEMDLLLGMLRRIQSVMRDELRIVVMSATLDSEALQQILGNPPIIRVAAESFPVKIHYSRFQSGERRYGRPLTPTRRIVEHASRAVSEAAKVHSGDILVFLPGVGEIRQLERNLQSDAEKQSWELLTLFGDMTPGDQDRVLARSAKRKVILSTNIAETSLTIDGVTVVVDSGWARVKRMDHAIGLDKLELEPISQASAKQRAGRAGRTAPGICYRLWDEATDRGRQAYLDPEISRVDFAGGLLHLMDWGESVENFPWVTRPTDESVRQAEGELQLLGAIEAGRLSSLGKRLLGLPVQPRIARFLVEAQRLGIARPGAYAAALLSERDIIDRNSRGVSSDRLQSNTSQPGACDVSRRVRAMLDFVANGSLESAQGTIQAAAARNVKRIADQFYRLLQDAQARDTSQVSAELSCPPASDGDFEPRIRQSLLAAFPDRLAKRRAAGNPRGLMVGGRGVKLDAASCVSRDDLFLCLDVDAAGSEATVRQASAVEIEWLPATHRREVDERFFNPTQAAVVTRRRLYWIDLLLAETPIATPLDDQTAEALATEAAKSFRKLLPRQDKELQAWLDRVGWAAAALPESNLPSFEPSELAGTLKGWCFGKKSLEELKSLPWKSLLKGLLDGPARKQLEAAAPESMTLPSGRTVLLQYEVGKPPVLAARIQEFFGWRETPRLAGGRVPLLLHLLAPNQRVQQITDDLASFWKNTYPVVRKELRGRYPKHDWPENPSES